MLAKLYSPGPGLYCKVTLLVMVMCATSVQISRQVYLVVPHQENEPSKTNSGLQPLAAGD